MRHQTSVSDGVKVYFCFSEFSELKLFSSLVVAIY